MSLAVLPGLDDLQAALPPLSVLDEEGEMDVQTRAVLGLMLERASCGFVEVVPVEEDPATCPNCGVLVVSTRSPYCGDWCREISAFIRQFRHGIEAGTLGDPERQAALGQKLWRMLGGGLPRRLAIIPKRAWERELEKRGRVCEECGAPAVTLDNMGGG
jgi:hypothetical protein